MFQWVFLLEATSPSMVIASSAAIVLWRISPRLKRDYENAQSGNYVVDESAD